MAESLPVHRYWSMVLYRARSGTGHFFGLSKRSLSVVATIPIGFAVHSVTVGREAVLEEFGSLVSFTFVPFVILATVIYLWNLLRAPSDMAREATTAATTRENELNQTISGSRANVKRLEEQLDEREKNRAIVTIFTDLAIDGDVIVMRARQANAIVEVGNDAADWANKVNAAVNEHCPEYAIEVVHLSTLNLGTKGALADMLKQALDAAQLIVRDFRSKT